ncbi:hypothetical protein BGZ76_009056 [Entomortierella beljakovae]|nr:hypothetical protein BGZ76_009056 [Entomortierella beljakovae]
MSFNDINNDKRNSLKFIQSPLLLLIIFGFLFDFSGAQLIPTVVYSPAYLAINETTLYIHGGSIQTNNAHNYPFRQLFSLDISQPWDDTAPRWKNLTPANTPEDSYHTIFLSKDQKSIVSWGFRSGLSTYSIGENNWTQTVAMPTSSLRSTGLQAVSDPNTGLVYIPSAANNGLNMMQYDTTTGATVSLPMPSEFTLKVVNYGVVWSTYANGIIMYGGQSGINNTATEIYQGLYQYSPLTSTWSLLSATGTSPGPVSKFCMASANNGTKIVIFGGNVPPLPGVLSGSIFTLDLTSMIWTQGPSVPTTANRMSTACTASGDNLIIWGAAIGNTDSTQLPDQTSVPTPGSSDKSNLGVIIGVVVAVVVLVAAVGFFIYARKKKARSQDQEGKLEEVEEEERVEKGDGLLSPLKMEINEPRDPQSLDKVPRLPNSREPQWPSQVAESDSTPKVAGPHALLPESKHSDIVQVNTQAAEQIEKIKAIQELQLQQRQLYLEQIVKEQDVLAKLQEQLNVSKHADDTTTQTN